MKIIITGASRGIGRGIAQVLAEAGHAVGLLARSRDLLDALASDISENGGMAVVADADLRDPEATGEAMATLIDGLGGIDALVNNAGTVELTPILETSVADWQAMQRTNVDGLFFATRAVLPTMKDQGSGHIVNISSISGHHPLPGGCAYAASKYAVTGFSESLMLEVRDWGVKVTTVWPGSVETTAHPDRSDGDAEPGWKVTPREVGEAIRDLLETRQQNLISKLEIRPLRKK